MSAVDHGHGIMTLADESAADKLAVAAATTAVGLRNASYGSSLTVQYLFNVAMISTNAWSVTGLRMYPATLSW